MRLSYSQYPVANRNWSWKLWTAMPVHPMILLGKPRKCSVFLLDDISTSTYCQIATEQELMCLCSFQHTIGATVWGRKPPTDFVQRGQGRRVLRGDQSQPHLHSRGKLSARLHSEIFLLNGCAVDVGMLWPRSPGGELGGMEAVFARLSMRKKCPCPTNELSTHARIDVLFSVNGLRLKKLCQFLVLIP